MSYKRTKSSLSRKVPAAVFAGLLALTSPLSVTPVFAESSASINAELEDAKKELGELSHRLEIASATVEDTQYQLKETTDQIGSLKENIKKQQAKVAEAQKGLAVNATSAYKGGTPSLVDMLLSSQDFSELTSRIVYANKVATKNNAKIDEVKGMVDTLNKDKDDLGKKEEKLKTLLKEQKASQKELKDSQAAASEYVNGLSSELQAALKAEREAEAERQRKEAEELAKKQAEELAKQQEQQAQQQSQQNSDQGEHSQQGQQGQQQTPARPTNPSPQRPTTPAPSRPTNPGNSGNSGSNQGGSGSLSSSARSTICSAAQSQLGVRYELGACSPGVAMDCSGLTTYAYAQAGINIPHSSRAQYSRVVSKGNLKTNSNSLVPGDLVFYQSGGVIYHVGVYIGGGQVCHANGYGQGVVITGVFYDAGFCGGGSPV